MHPIGKEQIPASVTVNGKLDKAVGWTDKNGENVAVFSIREVPRKGNQEGSAFLEVQHVIVDPPRAVRTVKDTVEKCDADMVAEFRHEALEITDLDKDGIGEITFAYAMNCASDMSPAVLKLLTLENGDKYILRGTTRIEAAGPDTLAGGEFVADPSFRKGPPAFFAHAKAAWPKVRPHSREDAAKAKVANRPACALVKWSGADDPTATVKDLTGKLSGTEGSDLTGKMEKLLTVKLDTPLCSPDGESIDEIQVNAIGLAEADFTKLWKSKGAPVTVAGEAATATTVHDHRPIVVRGSVKPR